MKSRSLVLGALAAALYTGCSSGDGAGAVASDLARPLLDASALSPLDLIMKTPLKATGEPCAAPAECAGIQAWCILNDNGVAWPSGSCVSLCDPANNDPDTGINAQCPGGNAACLTLNNGLGRCVLECTGKGGAMPCARAGYACFSPGFCQPAAYSQCDPTRRGSCAPDGGVDAMMGGRACERYGADDVGFCFDGCDLIAQGCAAAGTACYPTADTGEGWCGPMGPGVEGQPCRFDNGCVTGLGCHREGGNHICRHFCRTGANAVKCDNGQTCRAFRVDVATDVAGMCGP